MKKALVLAAFIAPLFTVSTVNAGPLEDATAASKQWVEAFNRGDYQYIGDAYTMNSTMIAHPFGDFHGRPAITAFWQQLIQDGADDLVYIEPSYTLVDDKTMFVKSRWTMNIGEGHITLEKWVLEPDGAWRLLLDDFTVEKRY
ncbi:nuclear transport factor 2 family protein [Enterovibrio sp. Hal110]